MLCSCKKYVHNSDFTRLNFSVGKDPELLLKVLKSPAHAKYYSSVVQGSKIALVRSYLQMPQAAGLV